MRLLVCGSRDWTDGLRIVREMRMMGATVIIHGAARGADEAAGFYGRAEGCDVLPFPADWNTHGRTAGPRRNAKMLREGEPNRGLAFGPLWRDVGGRGMASGRGPSWRLTGTGDMVKRMLAAGLPVRWVATPEAAAVDLVAMPEPPP